MKLETAKNHEEKGKNGIKRDYEKPIAKTLGILDLEKLSDDYFRLLNLKDLYYLAEEATRCGNTEFANRLLDIYFENSKKRCESMNNYRKMVHDDIEAKLLQVKTILCDVSTPLNDRIKEVIGIYEKSIKWADDSVLNKTKYIEILEYYLKFLEEYKNKSNLITQEKIETIKKLFEEMKKLE